MHRYNKYIATHRQQARPTPTGKRENKEVDIDSFKQGMKFSARDMRFWLCSRLMHEQQRSQHASFEANSQKSEDEAAHHKERSNNPQEKQGFMNFLVGRTILQKQRNGLQYKCYAFLLQLTEKDIEELSTDEKSSTFTTIRNSPDTPITSRKRASQEEQIQPVIDCKSKKRQTEANRRTFISNQRQATQIFHSIVADFFLGEKLMEFCHCKHNIRFWIVARSGNLGVCLDDQIQLQIVQQFIGMNNLFSNDLMKGVMGMMGNSSGWNSGSEKENLLRNNLQRCTYPDETKYMIEKAVKQLLHVYPFLTPDILMFTENGQPRRYIEVKGILEVEIKGKTCKVDFNMMLPNDYPRTPPFVRIVNRNPDYVVDAFYQSLKSKTDPTSYVLNDKLISVKAWAPSSSLVNVVIECYDLFKSKFPFSKPVENSYGAGNAWDALYNTKKNNNYGGNGSFNPPANNNWGSPSGWNNNNTNANNWGASNQANNGWQNNNTAWNANNPNPNTWGNNNPNTANNWNNPNTVNNNIWGPNPNNNNNTWGQPVGGMGAIGGMGGMGGIVGTNVNGTIASAQKLVGKQKQSLSQMGAQYAKVIEKVQQLDVTKRSLESQEEYLRKQNYEMANFLKDNESSEISSITSIVQPKDARSQQILQLLSGIKARQECAILLENKFSQQQLSLEQFLKHVRKIQQSKFQEKYLLIKCIKQN